MEPQKNETSVHMESKRYSLTGDKPPDFSLSLCSVILPSIPYQITILWFCTVLEGFLFPQYSYNFTLYVSGGFPGGSAGKESSCNVENLGLIPRLGWSPAEGNSYPLQYSGLENAMDCIVHGVTKSRTDWVTFFLKVCIMSGHKILPETGWYECTLS